MADSGNQAKLLDGRSWSVDSSGISSVTRRYLFNRGAVPSGIDSEEFATLLGLPGIGTKHALNGNLVVSGYDFSEGSGSAKSTVVVTVKYSAVQQSISGSGTESEEAVESWGWHSGSVARDLTHDVITFKPVLNSAGDPFDSVPQIDHPSPVFSKVIKTKSRQSGWIDFCNTINVGTITIGGKTCAPWTARVVQVDEERIIADPYGFKFRYSIGIQWLSNKVAINGSDSETEIGWNISVVDQGCREVKNDGSVVRIFEGEGEDRAPVTMPVLLDGQGHQLESNEPYVLMIHAYVQETFPEKFYSEPA